MSTSKRAFDLVFGGAALLFAAPLIALLMLAVRIDSPGAALFRQIRIGRDGRPFTLVKLRTLHVRYFGIVPGEEAPEAYRITRLGRWLRPSHFDELPQLWNVVRGEMSLVGPRPDIPEQVAVYGARERGRLAARPGMTGLAQISGNTRLSWPERIALDLVYLERWSLALDIRIALLTPWAILRGGVHDVI